MEIVNGRLATAVTLTEPATAGYLVLAAEIGSWAGPFALQSRDRELATGIVAPANFTANGVAAQPIIYQAVRRSPGRGADAC